MRGKDYRICQVQSANKSFLAVLYGSCLLSIMAPDRGRPTPDAGPSYQSISPSPATATQQDDTDIDTDAVIEEAEYQRGAERRFLANHADEPQNFTLRGILVGLGVGLIVCFSNMYFGLQSKLFIITGV